MWTIECDYTGAFNLDWPFSFQNKEDAARVCQELNALRLHIPDWKHLKPFKVCSRF